MLSQFIWSASIALEVFLLARGLQQKLTHKYPIFYSYIAYVLFEDVIVLLSAFIGGNRHFIPTLIGQLSFCAF